MPAFPDMTNYNRVSNGEEGWGEGAKTSDSEFLLPFIELTLLRKSPLAPLFQRGVLFLLLIKGG
jgi:hypothetical protein